MCAEQKQQKFSEIKAALDDADVLVLYRIFPFYYLFLVFFFLFFFLKFLHVTSFFPGPDSENGP